MKASNANAFKNKQNTPRNLNQPNTCITCEKNSNPSQKPYMGIAKKGT
jgi:hypothetical protein